MSFGYTRRCVLCLKSKPMAGGRTSGDGKRFVCAECHAKREAKAPAPMQFRVAEGQR